MDASDAPPLARGAPDAKAHHGPPEVRWQASERETVRRSPLRNWRDGSGLARDFFTCAAVVGAAMCSAC
jgi:hypothetical protein